MEWKDVRQRVEYQDGCWLYTGSLTDQGYGRATMDGRLLFVHRIAMGNPPSHLHVDHLCHNRDTTCEGGPTCHHRRCFNPAHLEVVTPSENSRRRHARIVMPSQCKRGHPYPEFVRWTKRGQRYCIECSRAAKRKYLRKKGVPPRPVGTCNQGHPRTPENTYVRPDGWRECRECSRETKRQYKREKRRREREGGRLRASEG